MGTVIEMQRRRPRIAPERPERLEIRMSVEERRRVTERARALGYESLGAFMRAAALGQAPRPAA